MESKKSAGLVCYRCGSFDIALINNEDNRLVFKCQRCGKVWIKRDLDGIAQK